MNVRRTVRKNADVPYVRCLAAVVFAFSAPSRFIALSGASSYIESAGGDCPKMARKKLRTFCEKRLTEMYGQPYIIRHPAEAHAGLAATSENQPT